MKKIVLVFITAVLFLSSCIGAQPTEPSVTLLSPNGGETFEKGELGLVNNLDHRLMIQWQVNGTFRENTYAVVKIRKGNGPAEILFAQPISPPWDKSEHSWSPYSIPERFEAGNDYKVEIVPVLSEKKDEWNIEMKEVTIGKGDTSDGYFSIIEREDASREQPEPPVTVLSPNGGEQWETGETHEITWASGNFSFDAPVQIGLRDDRYDPNLAKGEITIANTTNSGSYDWTIPPTLEAGSFFKVVIYIDGGGSDKYDLSDNNFQITQAVNPSATVFSSNGEEERTS